MKWFRCIIAASAFAGLIVGCSDKTATKPPNAPAIEDEKPLGAPKPLDAGAKQRGK